MPTQAAAKTGDGASSDGGNAAAGDATSGGMPAQDAAKTGNGASSNGGGAGDAAAGDALFGVRPQQLVGEASSADATTDVASVFGAVPLADVCVQLCHGCQELLVRSKCPLVLSTGAVYQMLWGTYVSVFLGWVVKAPTLTQHLLLYPGCTLQPICLLDLPLFLGNIHSKQFSH